MFKVNSLSLELARFALDAAAYQQKLSAHNIANTNTPGFQALRLNFTEQLANLKNDVKHNGTQARQLQRGFSPVLIADPNQPQAGISQLDNEVALMAQNTLHYESLIKASSKHLQLMSMAINEGRR